MQWVLADRARNKDHRNADEHSDQRSELFLPLIQRQHLCRRSRERWHDGARIAACPIAHRCVHAAGADSPLRRCGHRPRTVRYAMRHHCQGRFCHVDGAWENLRSNCTPCWCRMLDAPRSEFPWKVVKSIKFGGLQLLSELVCDRSF